MSAAHAVIDACFDEFSGVVAHPSFGRHRPDTQGDRLSKTLRRYPSYVIAYRISDESLEIARVLRGAMDFGVQIPDEPDTWMLKAFGMRRETANRGVRGWRLAYAGRCGPPPRPCQR